MIECYHVSISHVTDSLQNGRVFHEVIIFSIISARCRRAVPRALLDRSQLIEVVADTGRGGRATHPAARTRASLHAEAAVQARERWSDGWPWMASLEASPSAHMPSHLGVYHVSLRPHRQYPRCMCFVCGACTRISATYPPFSAILKHGSLLHMSSYACRGPIRRLG